MISEDNLIAKMLDLNKAKEMIANCPPDEMVILCPQWSINKPDYQQSDTDNEQFDLDELEELLGVTLLVTDYNDLVADVHGIHVD